MKHDSLRKMTLLGGIVAASALVLSGCSVTGATSNGGAAGDGTGTVNVLLMKQAGLTEDDFASIIDQFEKENSGITVKPTFVSYESLHDKIVTAAPSGTYDAVMIDVIWPAEFASKGIIADVTDKFPKEWEEQMLGGVLPTAKYQDKYYGVPMGPSTKLFFYNTDMMSKVGATDADLQTWDGVLGVARKIKSAGLSEYPIAWSWAQAEALICDYAQLLGAYGGEFTDSSGKLVINEKAGVDALTFMKASLDEGLSNPGSTTFLEDDVSKTLAQGETAFGLNWESTMRDLDDPSISNVVNTMGVMTTPAGPSGDRPGVNGSMALSIAANSKNKDAAWKFIEFATSEASQNQFVKSAMPNWKNSYTLPEIIATNPKVLGIADTAFAASILRPAVPNYSSASQIIQVEVQNALLGNKTPQQAMDDAVAQANKLLEG
ncbi:extracellular solute-binding protein [Leifsonia psychrotolerans]|nr:extracellular solute-binding protein [Leifsonia psychrotolerans]